MHQSSQFYCITVKYFRMILQFFSFLLVAAYCSRIQKFHQVVIIGAGISGLRASQILTEEGIPHIIIQSKGHIGGRIAPIIYDETMVDHGSSFYQAQTGNSSFIQAINGIKWPVQSATNEYKHLFFSTKKIELKQHEMAKVYQLQKKYSIEINSLAKSSLIDLPLSKAFKSIEINKKIESQPIKNVIEHIFETKANLKGSEMNNLSTKMYDFSQKIDSFQPVGGMFKLFQKLFRPRMDILHLNQRVLSLEYYKQLVTIKTNKGIYKAKRVISSLPLGVMQSNKVKFLPPLPQKYEEAIHNIGNSIYNKLYVSFSKRFWGNKKGWLNFISNNEEAYSTAYVQSNEQKNILIFYITEKDSLQMSKLTHQQIKKDLKRALCEFFDQAEITIQNIMLTKWHLDEDSLGSFSYFKVGTTKQSFEQLNKAIDKKLWLIGEHTNSNKNGCINGAYESGQRAAKDIVRLYRIKVFLQYIPAFGPYQTEVYKKEMSSGEVRNIIKMHQFIPIS